MKNSPLLIILLGLTLLYLPSCNNTPCYRTLGEQLQGTWLCVYETDSFYENWTWNDHELAGKDYRLNGGDTLADEYIRLYAKGDELIYEPQVINQNDGKPIPFTSPSCQTHQIEFTNTGHDFPQRISYRFISQNSFVAVISGTDKQGKEQKISFTFNRITNP